VDTDERRRRLRAVDLLAELPDAELDALGGDLVWTPVAAGQVIVSHLTPGAEIYFAMGGSFRAEMTTAFGKTVTIRQLKAGSHFGEIAALTGSPRSLTIVAETDGEVAICPADAFHALMGRDAAFTKKIAVLLARNVVRLTDRLFELAALEVRFRLYSELMRLARSGEQTAEGVLIRNPPTHEQLAATIGAQREAVTREFSYLSEQGVLNKRRRELVIADLDKLRDIVQRRAGVMTTQVVDWPV
jgi:CRP/FNR family transcriptional regulator, cyclic AMP receptor protein